MKEKEIKVAAKSNPRLVAGTIAKKIRESKHVEIVVVGAAAMNQALKAVAIAQSYLGRELFCSPEFITLSIKDETVTGMKLSLEQEPAIKG